MVLGVCKVIVIELKGPIHFLEVNVQIQYSTWSTVWRTEFWQMTLNELKIVDTIREGDTGP